MTNKFYAIVADEKIHHGVYCNEETLLSILESVEDSSAYETDGFVDPRTHYFLNNEIIPKPARPGKTFIWSEGERRWADFRDLEDFKKDKWSEIKAARAREEVSNLKVGDNVFNADLSSQTKISGAVQMAQFAKSSGKPFEETWTLQDNSEVDLDADKMIEVGMALGARYFAIHAYSKTLRTKIKEALSTVELDLVKWEFS